jgi:RNA polymerase sigma factor (sigma-70 family)
MAAPPAGEARLDTGAALDTVYAAEIRRLVALGTILAGDGATGEDLAHDAFLQLVRQVRKNPDYLRGPAWPLLRTIVVRLALQRRRGLAREARRLAREWHPTPAETWEPDPSRLDWHAALRQLPARMRATVVLFYGEDLSTAQTAEALGCSPRTVENQLRTARRRLSTTIGWTDEEAAE